MPGELSLLARNGHNVTHEARSGVAARLDSIGTAPPHMQETVL